MPGRIPKPCRVRSCRHRTVLDHGFCEQHQDRQFIRTRHTPDHRTSGWADRDQRKGNADQRGYGHRWRKLRQQVLRRDDHLCQACRRAGRLTRADCVDHITPKAQGGDDALTNLQSLCTRCHQAKTLAERGQHRPPRQVSDAMARALLLQGLKT